VILQVGTVWYEDYQFWIGLFSILATVGLGLLVWFSTKEYNDTQTKLANDRLEKELFTEFNKRYDELNECLEEITSDFSSIQDLHNFERGKYLRYKLNDYFNLCAEEYYWSQKGRIDAKIWKAWEIGMNSWYTKYPIIQEVWKEELKEFKPQSFYIKRGDEFFKKKK